MRKYIEDKSIDLVYLDPPFNSNADYNILFREQSGALSSSQIKAFGDTWHWSEESAKAYEEVTSHESQLKNAMEAFYTMLKPSDMLAYLSMMAPRLQEIHRVLKPTGSAYLHVDPTASHYLKLLMDSIFGPENFRNEIVWRNTNFHKSINKYGCVHQTLLFYSKDKDMYFKCGKGPYTKEFVEKNFNEVDERGRYSPYNLKAAGLRSGNSGKSWRGVDPSSTGNHWAIREYSVKKYHELTGDDLDKYANPQEKLDKLEEAGLIHWGKNIPRYKYYLDDADGLDYQDIWAYTSGTTGCVYGDNTAVIDQDVKWLTTYDKERLGFPTQKPLGLLKRIIKSSCPPNGIVLDPFCGCGTTVAAAQELGVKWIGIDITYLAIYVIEKRLCEMTGKVDTPESQAIYDIAGLPESLNDAKRLADLNRFDFQYWIIGLIGADPMPEKRGKDRGIDGIITFRDELGAERIRTKKCIISVKSGHVKSGDIRDLRGTMEREGAVLGRLITLEPPTKDMLTEAATSGFYSSPIYGRFPVIEIYTVKDILDKKELRIPHREGSLLTKTAAFISRRKGGTQARLKI